MVDGGAALGARRIPQSLWRNKSLWRNYLFSMMLGQPRGLCSQFWRGCPFLRPVVRLAPGEPPSFRGGFHENLGDLLVFRPFSALRDRIWRPRPSIPAWLPPRIDASRRPTGPSSGAFCRQRRWELASNPACIGILLWIPLVYLETNLIWSRQ